MTDTLLQRLLTGLQQAEQHNASVMVRPAVILWPDPDRQWEPVIGTVQRHRPGLLVLGPYAPTELTGPAIYLKCMLGRTLPEANWPPDTIPVVYLPGVSRQALRSTGSVGTDLQPLVEYQYSGVVWLQENGREWTVMALLTNAQNGLGLQVATDAATRETVVRALPSLLEEDSVNYTRSLIDADFLYDRLLPDLQPMLLSWLAEGDAALASRPADQRALFATVCRSRFGVEADVRNRQEIVRQWGSQRTVPWRSLWQYYANAPAKHPRLPDLLRAAKPDDLSIGVLALPDESWPQVNETREADLQHALQMLVGTNPADGLVALQTLANQHRPRLGWVWAELGLAPLAEAVQHLHTMATIAATPFPAATVGELTEYYINTGYRCDQAMRQALTAVRTQADTAAVTGIIRAVYQPWLARITEKFQGLIAADASVFSRQTSVAETAPYVLFVDALRYELAVELVERLTKVGYKTSLEPGWSALPSVTPTAKPAVSPVAPAISPDSTIDEFRPVLLSSGRSLTSAVFRAELPRQGYQYVENPVNLVADPDDHYWQEIGDIDTKGHQEGAGLVRRTNELMSQLLDTLSIIFATGITRLKIVTDHGWLLLPGGLPKTLLPKELTETRWGRCAIVKDGVSSVGLLQLPWRWNPGLFIAYAPGISFFKANEAYAHGGVSLHECLIPTLHIEPIAPTAPPVSILTVKWNGLRCVVTTDAPDGYRLDIRTKASDPASSVSLAADKAVAVGSGRGSIPADDTFEGRAATIVLTTPDGTISAKHPTTIGDN